MKAKLSIFKAGAALKEHSATGVDEIINAIQVYAETTTQQKWLVSPATRISSQAIPHDSAVEVCCPLSPLLDACLSLF